jgi:hypothetical protein
MATKSSTPNSIRFFFFFGGGELDEEQRLQKEGGYARRVARDVDAAARIKKHEDQLKHHAIFAHQLTVGFSKKNIVKRNKFVI